MIKSTFWSIALVAAILAMQSYAVETTVRGGARFSSGGHNWTEGTISSVGKDGRFSIRGSVSPYAGTYSTYHHGYYATPEVGRRTYIDGYRDRFAYTWSDDNLTDYTYTVPDYDSFVVYDEPNYGTDFTTWTYTTTPRTYHYGDLRVGDRVVVGAGTDGRVGHVYRVNPTHHRK